MGLLNDVKKAEATPAPKAEGTAVKAEKTPADKAARKAKAKERKEAKREALKRVLEYVKGLKDVPANISDDLKTLTVVERAGGSAFGPSKMSIIFGSEKPAAGTKVTATEVFTKAGLGYPEMKKYMKKWAEKGINVVLDPATATYIVK